MLIAISLGILIIISLFAIITGSSIKEIGAENISSTGTVNDTSSSYDISNIGATFYIDEFTGALVIIIAIMIIATLIGLQILGSGLSDTSVKIISIGITYYGIWSIFSILSYELILSIEVVGALMYIILTVVFTIGLVQKFSGSE